MVGGWIVFRRFGVHSVAIVIVVVVVAVVAITNIAIATTAVVAIVSASVCVSAQNRNPANNSQFSQQVRNQVLHVFRHRHDIELGLVQILERNIRAVC